jgi:predicted ABC-type ATPase
VKEIVILGGPNGAGKTTAARVLLPEFFDLHPFLNADELPARSRRRTLTQQLWLLGGR